MAGIEVKQRLLADTSMENIELGLDLGGGLKAA